MKIKDRSHSFYQKYNFIVDIAPWKVNDHNRTELFVLHILIDPFLLRSKSLQIIVIVFPVLTNLLHEEHCFKYFGSSFTPAPKVPTPRASRTCLGLMTSSGSFKLCLCGSLMMIVLSGTSLLFSKAPAWSCNMEMSCHHHWPSYWLQKLSLTLLLEDWDPMQYMKTKTRSPLLISVW